MRSTPAAAVSATICVVLLGLPAAVGKFVLTYEMFTPARALLLTAPITIALSIVFVVWVRNELDVEHPSLGIGMLVIATVVGIWLSTLGQLSLGEALFDRCLPIVVGDDTASPNVIWDCDPWGESIFAPSDLISFAWFARFRYNLGTYFDFPTVTALLVAAIVNAYLWINFVQPRPSLAPST